MDSSYSSKKILIPVGIAIIIVADVK